MKKTKKKERLLEEIMETGIINSIMVGSEGISVSSSEEKLGKVAKTINELVSRHKDFILAIRKKKINK